MTSHWDSQCTNPALVPHKSCLSFWTCSSHNMLGLVPPVNEISEDNTSVIIFHPFSTIGFHIITSATTVLLHLGGLVPLSNPKNVLQATSGYVSFCMATLPHCQRGHKQSYCTSQTLCLCYPWVTFVTQRRNFQSEHHMKPCSWCSCQSSTQHQRLQMPLIPLTRMLQELVPCLWSMGTPIISL